MRLFNASSQDHKTADVEDLRERVMRAILGKLAGVSLKEALVIEYYAAKNKEGVEKASCDFLSMIVIKAVNFLFVVFWFLLERLSRLWVYGMHHGIKKCKVGQ